MKKGSISNQLKKGQILVHTRSYNEKEVATSDAGANQNMEVDKGCDGGVHM